MASITESFNVGGLVVFGTVSSLLAKISEHITRRHHLLSRQLSTAATFCVADASAVCAAAHSCLSITRWWLCLLLATSQRATVAGLMQLS